MLDRSQVAQQVREVRAALRLSKADFAAKFGRSARTVEDWEQGRRLLDVPCQRILESLTTEAHTASNP